MNTKPFDQEFSEPSETLSALLAAENRSGIREFLTWLEPTAAVRALFRLNREQQEKLVGLLSADQAADLLEDLPDVHAADLMESIDAGKAADIVEALTHDHGADLLGAMDTEDADAILAEMAPGIAGEVRKLIAYPTDVAGGLMGTEHFAWPETARVADFLHDIGDRRQMSRQLPQRVILLDARQRPTGAVEIADLLTASPEASLAGLKHAVEPLAADTPLEELEDYFDRHETLGGPVVDAEGRLVGRLRRRAVADALSERAQADQLKVQGIVGGEELRTMPVLSRSRRRLSWLSVNIFLNVMAASVIALFQDTLAAVIALTVFLPIVSDMSGCSGNQAVAVSMRELTLGIIRPRDFLRVWWREVSVGLLNGIALGLMLAIVAFLWQGSPVLGLVVGLALALNTIVAVSIGGTVPLLLRAAHVDPAVASGPVLTTVTDICGFFFLLAFATVALPWLT
jgi:magnesium transporter